VINGIQREQKVKWSINFVELRLTNDMLIAPNCN
jgi:hypothetical protein